MRKLGLLLLVPIVALGIAFTGCDKKDDNNNHTVTGPGDGNGESLDSTLVGTWNLIMSFADGNRLPDEELPDISITINSDGTGSGVEDSESFTFSWSTNGSTLTVTDEDSSTISAVYAVNGDTLTMSYTDTWTDSNGVEIPVEMLDYYLKDTGGGNDQQHDPDLVDTWRMVGLLIDNIPQALEDTTFVTFVDDGTGTTHAYTAEGEEWLSFTWFTNDGILTVIGDDFVTSGVYTVDENIWIYTYTANESAYQFTYIRSEDNGGGGGGNGGDANLVGVWLMTGYEVQGIEMPIDFIKFATFSDDGSGEYYTEDEFSSDTMPFTWSADGSTLSIEIFGDSITGSYSVNATTWIFTYSMSGIVYVETYSRQQ